MYIYASPGNVTTPENYIPELAAVLSTVRRVWDGEYSRRNGPRFTPDSTLLGHQQIISIIFPSSFIGT